MAGFHVVVTGGHSANTGIASAAKQSISPCEEKMDCFAALAMTAGCTFAFSRCDVPEVEERLLAGIAAALGVTAIAVQLYWILILLAIAILIINSIVS